MNIEQSLHDFMVDESLPESFKHSALQWYVPLLERVTLKVQLHQDNAKTPFFMGVNGAQGSGKSTLSALLVKLFLDVYGLKAVCMSLDDFYLTQQERIGLSASVHPLLKTRGVPGTHDTFLLNAVLTRLMNQQACDIPVFDKSIDDRAKLLNWQNVSPHIDIVILEGWCVGCPAQTSEQLQSAINALEIEFDADGAWRSYVNSKLSKQYQSIFAKFNYLIMLKAPSFQQIYAWRCEQEHKMQQKNVAMGNAPGGMTDEQIKAFIQYYERITVHGLTHLPKLCDEVFILNEHRSILTCKSR